MGEFWMSVEAGFVNRGALRLTIVGRLTVCDPPEVAVVAGPGGRTGPPTVPAPGPAAPPAAAVVVVVDAPAVEDAPPAAVGPAEVPVEGGTVPPLALILADSISAFKASSALVNPLFLKKESTTSLYAGSCSPGRPGVAGEPDRTAGD